MSIKKEVTKEQIEEFFKKNFYISSELLTYYTLIAINSIREGKVRIGQDIYTTTLDGPPGSGKSMYAKLYAQMIHELLGEETTLISYQCDDSTSKIELFEDINVGAAVASEPEKVNIPGVLARAINEVNQGKKVILFIDEYDKTREQVDSLFLQMLQDGIINTNQFGDMKIEDENKGNLQVIFCKNDFRTELTGPLTRRTRMIYLDIIKPCDFRELAIRILYDEADDKQEKTIIDLVSLLYEEIYNSRDEYKRVCATSELFGAIQDLTYLSRIEAPNYILYETLICDLFKNSEDKTIFESRIPSIENVALKNTLTALSKKDNQEENITVIDILSKELKEQAKIDAEIILQEEKNALTKKQAELEGENRKIAAKLAELEQEKAKVKKYLKEVEAKFNELIAKKAAEVPQFNYESQNIYALNFNDSTNYIRRGHNIFETMNNTIEIGSLSIPLINLNNDELVSSFLKFGAVVFENGFLFSNPCEIVVARTNPDIDGKITFHFFMNKDFLETDSKKDKSSSKKDKSSYYIIKNMLKQIISLILAVNKSDLQEQEFRNLSDFYKDKYEYLSYNNDIAKVVLKKARNL